MYTQFFGLKEKPFSITPDPRYLFMSKRHAEAFAHLMYGINEAGGFVQLTGEIGAGKTTLVRSLLEQLPKHADVAAILNPRVTPHELLLSICQDIGIALPDNALQSLKALVDALNVRLLEAHAKGRRMVVIVDEAQNLSAETLEQVRLLTNLETASTKLLQIILIGQPELRDILAGSGLKQLAQRIVGRYHLTPLSRDETVAYIQHRLKIAGATTEIFTNGALGEVHRLSQGVPRVINTICDRALLGAYSMDRHRVDASLVRRAASEVFDRTVAPRWWAWAGAAAGVAGVAILAAGLSMYWNDDGAEPVAATPAAASAAPAPVASAPPAGVAMDAEILLANPTLGANTGDRAFARLFDLWRAKFDPEQGRACDQAAQQGLECVYQKGSFGQLRVLNRPAILSLADTQGQKRQAVLSSLQEDTAHIDVGSGPVKVTLASLSRVWLGEYLIVWRPESLGQPLGQRALARGMQGDEVRSLRRGLDVLDGREIAPADAQAQSDFYDDELARRIETFQRANRLNVDGIAGVQTQIVLDSIVNSGGAPRLLETQARTLNSGEPAKSGRAAS